MRNIQDNSTFSSNYELTHNWPEDCKVQGGSKGAVVGQTTGYVTAYFEAFPKNPSCFIRGEGKDMKEAEDKAYEKFIKYTTCPEHEFEKVPSYHNGMGKCKHCGMMKVVFEDEHECIICGKHENFITILPKYKKNENSCMCKECAEKKENFKYLRNRDLKELCHMYNGILLIKPVMDKETLKKLKECPSSFEELYSILEKDSNPYLEERVRRMANLDESEVHAEKLESLEEVYSYIYDNYIERWVGKLI